MSDLVDERAIAARVARTLKLERLQRAVMILCDPGRWTDERGTRWQAVTGKEMARYIDLYELAKECDE